MLTILSDTEIDALIHEPKSTPSGLLPYTKLVEHNKHLRRDYAVNSASGNEFVIYLRKSTLNAFDFSAILGYRMPESNAIFRLRRYNGRHFHTNTIEGTVLNDFHFHTATERYQRRGAKEDSFAQATSRHSTLDDAIRCLIEDCGFDPPAPAVQGILFPSPVSK
jgi:hypothetical protein